ncbi:hypothetical protein CC85DRAFT_287502 [Cutaneotrichosporon oleaginosum]|uniref:ATP-dependent DNA ligase family profile domain-containing protein n=1 Tax=Cutaneotrichosporon oleaginosum TaxID=879819 RepID=A0A0J0XH37_9TREE|nr:uncharacterized protein CC85DRAFT_287502 [Cutaneotrichosporon oleaginosum]KLT40401.1 hypothetical protein CC85DRAFT_287502 [Cutaneotrichosporon oleaginosum]TXT11366.1 hypothetical protein COLE_01776 [Cutaneotrichosporon oleaginosum]
MLRPAARALLRFRPPLRPLALSNSAPPLPSYISSTHALPALLFRRHQSTSTETEPTPTESTSAVTDSDLVPASIYAHAPDPKRATSAAVREQLRRLGEMIERTAATQKGKKAVVGEYPDQKELLEFVLDKSVPAFVLTVRGIELFLEKEAPGHREFMTVPTPPETLMDLFRLLSAQRLTGNSLRAAVAQFLLYHGIIGNARDFKNPTYIVFSRLLSRKLMCGIAYPLLSSVEWQTPEVKKLKELKKAAPKPAAKSAAKPAAKQATPQTKPTTARTSPPPPAGSFPEVEEEPLPEPRVVEEPKIFKVALGQATQPPFDPVFEDGKWYASRKLDGLRCITYLDFAVPRSGEPWLVDVRFLSRSGNEFASLENLKKDIWRNLPGFPGLRDLVLFDNSSPEKNGRRRLVLDGEVCVMRPLTPEEAAKVDHGTAGRLWEDDGLTEDFRATVSQVKRKYSAVQYPAYFLFDVLHWSTFAGAPAVEDETFAQRQKLVQELGAWLSRYQQKRGLVRALRQEEIVSREQLNEMVERAAREGWEGLMLRKDTKYKASRSSSLLKYKQWQDAEYEVVDIETSTQRLAVDGKFGEYEALAAAIIEHEGHRVAVGSGWTALQRLRFRRPENIVGSTITVEYFGVSEVPGREGKSLRFPRVKAVYDGPRDV